MPWYTQPRYVLLYAVCVTLVCVYLIVSAIMAWLRDRMAEGLPWGEIGARASEDLASQPYFPRYAVTAYLFSQSGPYLRWLGVPIFWPGLLAGIYRFIVPHMPQVARWYANC
jgi:hypothetical protein